MKELIKDQSSLHDFNEACRCEWLETNGLGGWAGSSVIGTNTRRYHGLLVAAVVPPAERMVLVSKLDETIITGNERYELGTNNYGDTVYPTGHRYMTHFSKGFFPNFTYEAGGVRLNKTIAMVHGENTVAIIYKVLKADQPFTLELLPLLAGRGYHRVLRANDKINTGGKFQRDVFQTKLYDDTPTIFVKVPAADYHPGPNWFYNFNYPAEQYRGLDYIEDLFSPGKFTVELKQGASFGIIISTDDPSNKEADELLEIEQTRRESLLKDQPSNDLVQQLTLAADQFIVKRNIASQDNLQGTNDGATIIAGYHWFTDWGRDTMISLPGLCLATGRYDDARKILLAFAHSVSKGMLPNRFRDGGEEPEYNNVDGTLWYFIAVYKYLQATGDQQFIQQEILPVLKNIIDWHFKGTRFNIHVAEDGLLYAGEIGQQLTWMDAKVGEWVVTPRMGKPVEIQALWYNALKIFAELLRLNDQWYDASIVEISADKAKKSFTDQFWYEDGHYLYDVIDQDGKCDMSFRPNQLFAISLPFALIEGPQAAAILELVEEKLYTPAGLKTLPTYDERYIPVYGGDQFHRDAAYHQGTVWSWLLGPYIDAMIKVGIDKEKVKQTIDAFAYHLNEAGIGTISEIFDADPPHHPRGCIAQAWGVAEVLRVITEYKIYVKETNLAEKEIAATPV